MKVKSTEENFKIFKMDKYIQQFLPINENYSIKELHTDLEIAIGAAAKKLYKNINI